MRRRCCIGLVFVLGCSGSLDRSQADAGQGAFSSTPMSDGGFVALADAGPPDDAGAVEGPLSDAGQSPATFDTGLCGMAPPPGSPTPPPPPTYGGTCPTLVNGHNDIMSSGSMRNFRLVVPTDYDPSKSYPLFFLWHWLHGSADAFYDDGMLQTAVDAQHFIAVIPEAKGDLPTTWPFMILDSSSRLNEGAQFFDDMYACVAAQYSINRECVTTIGVSAGALWTDQLVGMRGQYFSSFVSLSGGTGGSYVKSWHSTSHAMPALVLWGGPSDTCVVNMAQASMDLESHLTSEGHFVLECIHNCGHSTPPFMGMTSTYSPLWEFVMQHPYWLPAGTSPFQTSGLPSDFPSWCGVGAGSATMRSGACSGSAC